MEGALGQQASLTMGPLTKARGWSQETEEISHIQAGSMDGSQEGGGLLDITNAALDTCDEAGGRGSFW